MIAEANANQLLVRAPGIAISNRQLRGIKWFIKLYTASDNEFGLNKDKDDILHITDLMVIPKELCYDQNLFLFSSF